MEAINTAVVEQYFSCVVCSKLKHRRDFSKKHFPSRKCKLCQRAETAKRCKTIQDMKVLNGPGSGVPSEIDAEADPHPVLQSTDSNSRKAASGMRRRPNNFGYCDYVDHVMGLRCYPDIVNLRVFSTAKDVSESMAAIRAAAEETIIKALDKPEVLCLCIGDGNTPRTAVLAAYWKQWNCVSIDPNLKEDWVGKAPKGVRGLTGFRGTFQEYLDSLVVEEPITISTEGDRGLLCQPVRPQQQKQILVLLCVHSHVQFRQQANLDRVRSLHQSSSGNGMVLVSIPCCPGFRHIYDVGRDPDKSYQDDCVFSACRTVNIWRFYAPP